MELVCLAERFAVCKLAGVQHVPQTAWMFVAVTPQEVSLVCPEAEAPPNALCIEGGWRGLMVRGPLDFGMVGVLAQLSRVLADAGIGIVALSTYDTDYILIKQKDFDAAASALIRAGHSVAKTERCPLGQTDANN